VGYGDSYGVDRRGTWGVGKQDYLNGNSDYAGDMGDNSLARVREAGVRGDIFRVSHDHYRLGSGHSDGQKLLFNFGRFVL
jgi:hypothetical protein